MKSKQRVAVIIVNWNKGRLTKQCVESLRRQTMQPTQVIVVDNGSTDDSIDILESLTGIELVRLKSNCGFAGGMNKGFERVKSDLVLLLNNDCVLADNWIAKATQILTGKADLVGGVEYQYKSATDLNNDQLPYKAAPVINPDTGITYETNEATKLQHVPYTTASNVMMPAKLFAKLQGFDERFFAYYEDVDLCARVFAVGKQVCVSNDLKAWHDSGSTARNIPYKIAFLKTRNRYFFLYRQASDNTVAGLPKLINKEWLKNSLKIVGYPVYALIKNEHEMFKELCGQWKAYVWLKTHRNTLVQMRADNKQLGTYSDKYWRFVAKDHKERKV